MLNLIRIPSLALACLLVVGCAGSASTRGGDDLFEALGGMPRIERFISAAVTHASTDPMIGDLFMDSDLIETTRLLAEQVCELAGGPCQYSGRSMEEAHSGMDIRPGEFNRLVEILQDAMRVEGVPLSAENRIIERLARLQGQVVGQ